ncbi:hypothetical protein ACIQOW_06470 [Kitasatospora sp. NPDC091335]|uniref:hypothetical protein n=1 Tax=Kitasatospora sp. NPDC091335 TaxID=3364085 RepID=UPI00380DE66A
MIVANEPGPDRFAEWSCASGHFGFLLPPEYVELHPEDDRVQVCGTKRRSEANAARVVV